MAQMNDNHYGICCVHKGRMFLGDPNKNIVTFSALYDYDNFDEVQMYFYIETASPLSDLDWDTIDKSYIVVTPYDDLNYSQYVYDNNQWVLSPQKISRAKVIIDPETKLSIPDYSVIAGDFKVTNADGRIISLKSFDDKLIIFCEHSIHLLYGDTPDTSMQNQFQLVDLNNNLGAVSDRCIAIGGGRLFFLGDNNEIYEYSGASLNIISRPGKTRNTTLSVGAVSGVIEARDIMDGMQVDKANSHSKFACTSEKLYVNIWNRKMVDDQKLLFVFDIYNRTWWCEDGEFNTIGTFSFHKNKIFLGCDNGDILVNNETDLTPYYVDRTDKLYDFETNKIIDKDIEYEFHTRVYGADGADLRKSLSRVWVQARANATMYVNDIWTSIDVWSENDKVNSNLIEIGMLEREYQPPTQETNYRETTYEQQVCYVPKMYEQRVNAFQIIVKGKGGSRFYLMKRVWRAR